MRFRAFCVVLASTVTVASVIMGMAVAPADAGGCTVKGSVGHNRIVGTSKDDVICS